jgi:hypothetical protein
VKVARPNRDPFCRLKMIEPAPELSCLDGAGDRAAAMDPIGRRDLHAQFSPPRRRRRVSAAVFRHGYRRHHAFAAEIFSR